MNDRNYDFVESAIDELRSADRRIEQLEDALDAANAKAAEWIPVSERLPEDGVDVLVSYGAGEDAELLIAHWRTDERGWFDDEGLRVPLERICHWMPLPEPPEVK